MSESKREERDSAATSAVLVVQEGNEQAAKLCKRLRCRFSAVPVGTLSAAYEELEYRSSLVGAIIAPKLPDGDGFGLVETLRQRSPAMPLLMVSSAPDAAALSRAHLAHVHLVNDQDCMENLKAFAMRVNTHAACARDGIKEILTELTHAKRLTLRESQILAVAAHGIPRSRIAKRLGTSENTIKSQIRSLLDKTQKANLSEVVWLVHSQTDKS